MKIASWVLLYEKMFYSNSDKEEVLHGRVVWEDFCCSSFLVDK